MTVYVPTLVFTEHMRDETVSKLSTEGKHCIIFRDSVQPCYGIVGCSQNGSRWSEQRGSRPKEIVTVLNAYCQNNPNVNARDCELLRRQYLRRKQLCPNRVDFITIVHNGVIFCNADVDAILQKPPVYNSGESDRRYAADDEDASLKSRPLDGGGSSLLS